MALLTEALLTSSSSTRFAGRESFAFGQCESGVNPGDGVRKPHLFQHPGEPLVHSPPAFATIVHCTPSVITFS